MTNPPPAATAAVPATIGRRVGAYVIDVAIACGIALVFIGVCAAIIFAVGPAWTQSSLALAILLMYTGLGFASLAWALVYTAMQGVRGSIGQRMVGIRLADAATGGPIGFWRALLRNIVFGLAGSIVVGYFSPLFDSSGRRQGWHDKVASALVVDRTAAEAPAAAPAPAPADRVPHPHLPQPAGALATPAGGFTGAGRPPAFGAPGTPSVSAPTGPVLTGAAAAPATAPAYAGAAIPPRPPLPSAQAAPAVVVPSTGMIAHVPGITGDRPAWGGTSVSSVVDDDLDSTLVAPSRSVAAAGRAALDPDARAIAVLTWDDGGRMAVYGRTLYGRNPAAEEGAVSVAVRDETLSLSKTHFEIGCDDSGAWIVDRHSTNGTILVRDGMRHPLLPGRQTSVRPGDRLEFGDRSATVSGP
ncbi:RDD family protein [Microbacterium immunditiarum]|uniref:Putative RDD family membrane protein YckC n=1 Tax=Microbacterium immunditiarum TaxID=337480 RepID=A0A7Y9GLS9_9MICO|nr:RDD family protein [Microbacterium immunditiarum]NYE18686.1 putative RDD family membrane protein YckC [Microbacterium immunditiarum]